MRIKRQIPLKGKTKIAVIVDGETEFWYLQMLKRNEREITVDIKPEIPQKKKLEEQYKKAIKLSEIYDKVIWIVDLDVILKESQMAPKGKKKPLAQFLEYRNDLEKKHENIKVIINQPCLEFWLLIHFELISPHFSSCEGAEKLLKKYLTDYAKTEKYYTKEDNDIYLKLKANLSIAIRNSKRLSAFDLNTPYQGLSEMFILFKELGIS
jgi:deoxyribodipyrimidine photolyase